MEDCLHVHRIRAKQWPNDRKYLIQLGIRMGSRNRTEIGVDRALTLTGTTDPRAGVEVRTNFLRQRKIAGTNGNSLAPRPGEPSFVCLPVLERILFYDQILQNSCFLFTNLHRNLTHIAKMSRPEETGMRCQFSFCVFFSDYKKFVFNFLTSSKLLWDRVSMSHNCFWAWKVSSN
jgi:hypothetical protein